VPAGGALGAAETELMSATGVAAAKMEAAFLEFGFRRAAAALLELCWAGNRYYDQAKPWETRKQPGQQCATSLRVCAEVIRSLAVLAAPIVPAASERIWRMLALPGSAATTPWSQASAPGLPAGDFVHGAVASVFEKIPDEQIQAELAKLAAATMATGQDRPSTPATPPPPLRPAISYEDFAKLDLRIGTILKAERHPDADRLLKIEVDLGLEQRQVIAGIAGTYPPADLVGRQVVVLANLAPKKLRGLVSHGMLLAADRDGQPTLLSIERPTEPGTPIK
jgi:methionyl-tRNA synthetase